MIRLLKIFVIFMFVTSAGHAEIITMVNSSTATGSEGQSSDLLSDYLRLRLFRESVERSVGYISTIPQLAESEKDAESIKLISLLVARVKVLSTNMVKEGNAFKVTMKLQVDIDSETVRKYLPQSLENNQFKAFGRKFSEGLINLETRLLTAKTVTPEIASDMMSTVAIQRSRAYEMNSLSLNEFTEKSSKDEADQQIIKEKERNVKNIQADMKAYEDEIAVNLKNLLSKIAEESKYKLKILTSIEKKYSDQNYSFNSSPDHDIVSAKNEIITTRKKIQLIVKSFFHDTDMLKLSINDGYDNITKYISNYKFYDADPIKDRWESSYHYEFRLNNYKARKNQEEAFINDSMKSVLDLKYRTDKIIKINSLLSLVKILEPYQNHLKDLQDTQYMGVGVDNVYIKNIGTLNRNKKYIPFKVTYLGEIFNLNFNIQNFDESTIKYLVNYSKYFVVYPLFRLSSNGDDAYDIEAIHSGFLISNRGNKIKEPILTNTRVNYFPEVLYADEFKRTLLEEKINISDINDNLTYDLTNKREYLADNTFITFIDLTKVASNAMPATSSTTTTYSNSSDNSSTINFNEFIDKDSLEDKTTDIKHTDSALFRMLFKGEVKNRYAGSISITPSTSNGLTKYSNSNYLLKNGIFGLRGDMQFWYINVQPSVRFMQSGRGKDADLNRYDMNRLDALVYANYQLPIYFTHGVTLLPYAGVGGGVSYFYSKLKTGEEKIPDVLGSTTLLLSAQAGMKATYNNFLVGIGVQVNYANPIIYDKVRNMNNYSFLIEIGYAFFNSSK